MCKGLCFNVHDTEMQNITGEHFGSVFNQGFCDEAAVLKRPLRQALGHVALCHASSGTELLPSLTVVFWKRSFLTVSPGADVLCAQSPVTLQWWVRTLTSTICYTEAEIAT